MCFRHDMHQLSSPLVIMMVLLAINDFMYCCSILPTYAIGHAGVIWGFRYVVSPTYCVIAWGVGLFCGFQSWVIIGLIAVVRAACVFNRGAGKFFAQKGPWMVIIPTLWVFTAILLIPFVLNVSTHFIGFYQITTPII